jgi:hypothetical protein
MLLRDAIKGYTLDCKIAGQTMKHIIGEERELHRLRTWCEERGVARVEEVTLVLMKEYVVHLQTLVTGGAQLRRSNRGKTLSAHSVVDYTKMIRRSSPGASVKGIWLARARCARYRGSRFQTS